MKEMTILDLINKSVTGEEMPSEVKYEGDIYTYSRYNNNYYNHYNVNSLFKLTNYYLDIVTIPETETEKQTRTDKEHFETLSKCFYEIANTYKNMK